MNWDDLRFVATLARLGSLVKASKALGVDHTTVGRRIDAAEQALGLKLFTRTSAGYTLTGEGAQIAASLQGVEDAVLAFERGVHARNSSLDGTIRITSPETFGVAYLAPRLAKFGRRHPSLIVELAPAGTVMDLSRQEAELAVRFFRTRHDRLVIKHVGDVAYGLYASAAYLKQRPVKNTRELGTHAWLLPTSGVDLKWVEKLVPRVTPVFVSDVSLALAEAACADAGVTVLPRYLGDATRGLEHIEMPDEPGEAVWMTVHRDLRNSPRVRVMMDFLTEQMRADQAVLMGR